MPNIDNVEELKDTYIRYKISTHYQTTAHFFRQEEGLLSLSNLCWVKRQNTTSENEEIADFCFLAAILMVSTVGTSVTGPKTDAARTHSMCWQVNVHELRCKMARRYG